MNINDIAPHSDITPKTLAAYAEVFRKAHERTPDGLSLEVGTRSGGSALMWLQLLDELYQTPPFLFTVDPYGTKPYMGYGMDYSDDRFVQMKQLLASYPNHAHFRLTSLDFLEGVAGRPFWVKAQERLITGFSFVFLDGDHSYAYVKKEIQAVRKFMRDGATILIDNADQPDVARLSKEYEGSVFVETGLVIA